MNANASDLLIYGSPIDSVTRLVGCPDRKCADPTPFGDTSGAGVGWTETRPLPRRYRMELASSGRAVVCPPATGPTTKGQNYPYAVVYAITRNGRCVIASHAPPN